MTDQTPVRVCGSRTDILLDGVEIYRQQPELLLFDAVQSMFGLGERCPRKSVGWILDRALCEVETDGPRASFDDIRSDATFWADAASPREIEVYFVACLRQLMSERGKLNTASVKRLLVALWAVLPEGDKRAFLAKLDPDGAFRRS